MFSLLARKSKAIAWFFAWLFYLNVLASFSTAMAEIPRSYFPSSAGATLNIYNNAPSGLLVSHSTLSNTANANTKIGIKKNTPFKGQKNFTTGPGQPEMQSFQSVNSNNMVDLFSGDFSYNIPLLDVGGYPVNLHYQSGISMDQEASWVGLGFNINPGTISRNMRGLPDDFRGDSDAVTKTVSMKPNRTFGMTVGANAELFGSSKLGKIGIGASIGMFHNTYKGWGIETGINANLNSAIGSKGSLTSGLSITNNSQDGLGISPSFGFHLSKNESNLNGTVTIGTNFNSRVGVQSLQISGQVRQQVKDYKNVTHSYGGGNINSYISFASPSFTPKIQNPFTSTQITFTSKIGLEIKPFHPNAYIRGYASFQRIEESDQTLSMPAYGYLYYEKANGRQDVLLDFNREKETSFREKTPHIAVPIYTYDTYTITGEGTGGMFRPYRGDIGFVYDPVMATKSSSNSLSLDVGFGDLWHGGVDYNTVYATTKSTAWRSDNAMKDVSAFREKDSTFENVYFKNPGEKGSVNQSFLDAIGDDNLVRVDLSPGNNTPLVSATRNISMFKNNYPIGKRTLKPNTLRTQRDKRTQVISYLTASEAVIVGLEKTIRSYAINSFPSTSCTTNYTEIPRMDNKIKRSYHLSEVSVLNADGRRYIYGVPVYNTSQRDVTMSTAVSTDPASGLVSYTPGEENSTKNIQGKEGYFNREELPPYSHSFLLSGILSPDYVDITGDGITEDDNGDAVKFNYSRIYSAADPFKWRAPNQENQASYNDGLKTDKRDDKGTYTYGTKEVWYLNSIESKTMIATFVLDTDSVRKDAYGVLSENGGQNTAQKLYRLKQINLYTKADYLKNGVNAKPIKSVHFKYNYSLCKKNPGSLADSGKLTLEQVWFTYNNNNKGKLNPYTFTYHQNPDYNGKSYDRWGNYKDVADNPGVSNQPLTNADFPYSLQKGNKTSSGSAYDTGKSNINAGAWTLSEIRLPSGGKIKVTYESDDYAYVQNKRAMQFFSLAGLGSSSSSSVNNSKLYPDDGKGEDYSYVFIDVPEQVIDKADIYRKYLDGVSRLYFKIFVKMPSDIWGSGYEMVPCYADIEDYGVKGSSSDKRIWIKLGAVKGTDRPLPTAAIQFLRLNLPSKAYPYSEPGNDVNLRSMIGMLGTIGGNVQSTISGFSKMARNKNFGKDIVLAKSFVRLNNPGYKKYGGGLRVKKIEIEDNWDKMTGQQMNPTTFGQEYNYTTTITVNGVNTKISSGVASYEPAVGNDENPFHVPFKLYTEKEGIMAPTDFVYVEEPFAETFFPSPMVGYSKVTVQTINKTRKSATGYEETEFYTSNDFPTIVELTPLDNDSKKTYNPKINNFFKINAKNFVTLSQGFKVELNDMNGKVKSQSTYAQNDLKNPISFTYNYYRLQNDASGKKKLSNTVSIVDSANGVINSNGQIGKEVEIMMDVREQVSTTLGGSLEANVDVFTIGFWGLGFPVVYPSLYPLPSSETNRYRSIAILKIVNKYGLLDSVIHTEKGSRVATRNLVYDGETGDVLLSQTNNEFDDPIYNFSYPAHWAYSGMGLAYKNIGTVFSNVRFHLGKMYYQNGKDTFPVSRYFESGDEILTYARHSRYPTGSDSCQEGFYIFTGFPLHNKIWAIDASKGKEGDKGIYFIDQDGKPYTAGALSVKIIRSGKRNMPGTPVGSITSLQSPVKSVSGVDRIVFDSTTMVIAGGAAKFKDMWRVDSTTYAKDTIVIGKKMVDTQAAFLVAVDGYSIYNKSTKRSSRKLYDDKTYKAFEASSYDEDEDGDFERRSWIKFDIATGKYDIIPKGAVIKSAKLELRSHGTIAHENMRNSNSSYLQRVKGRWIGKVLDIPAGPAKDKIMDQYFHEHGLGSVDAGTKATIPETPSGKSDISDDTIDVTNMMQEMVDDYYNKNYDPSIMIKLIDPTGGIRDGRLSRLAYSNHNIQYPNCRGIKQCMPTLKVVYYMPCIGDTSADYSSLPVPGYYCYDNPKDTFICKPNIVDSSVNPYRWGILGNWRMDRAYTYYDRRKDSDPNTLTNIRKDGEIKNFAPYWSFNNTSLSASNDSSRWVWNSEITLFNKKGYEIENRDPLGRYNSGQYGYNQTLPVAVAQNSKSKNMMFDGFEDYDYRTDTCKRCPAPRFIDLTNGGGNRIDSISHTGKYSLRIGGNTNATVAVKIDTVFYKPDTTRLSIDIDSLVQIDTVVVPNGIGIRGTYKHNLGRDICRIGIDPIIDFQRGPGHLSDCSNNFYEVLWEGSVQPVYTDSYTFYTNSNDGAGLFIKINGVWQELIRQPAGSYSDGDGPNDGRASYSVALKAGTLYNIRVYYRQIMFNAKMNLSWSSSRIARQTIPQVNLYPPDSTGSGTIQTINRYCVRLRNPKPEKIINNRFNPQSGTKIVVSAWVKEDGLCTGSGYSNVSVQLTFNAGSPSTVTLTPKGNIIEGWQRIEDTLTIPLTATAVSLVMRATSSTAVFFDDVRIHPFNSNMKSFVYNPVNIRLMAELDENNYATFYEYDDDGTLIRVKKETERGIKTIKETRSALLKE